MIVLNSQAESDALVTGHVPEHANLTGAGTGKDFKLGLARETITAGRPGRTEGDRLCPGVTVQCRGRACLRAAIQVLNEEAEPEIGRPLLGYSLPPSLSSTRPFLAAERIRGGGLQSATRGLGAW